MVIFIIGVIVGGIIYFVLCYMFKVEEIVEIKNVIMKKIRR